MPIYEEANEMLKKAEDKVASKESEERKLRRVVVMSHDVVPRKKMWRGKAVSASGKKMPSFAFGAIPDSAFGLSVGCVLTSLSGVYIRFTECKAQSLLDTSYATRYNKQREERAF